MGSSNCKTFSPNKKVEPQKSPTKTMANDDSAQDYIEDVVCKKDDIQENEMKVFSLGCEGGKILLVKQKGQYYALGTKCTHYGAPLNTGALGEGRIRCPWHGACFNIETGDIEDYPGLDSLPSYLVIIENDLIKVRAKKSDLSDNKRLRTMCRFKAQQSDTVVIVGGGPAAATCAETLRQEGFTGKIVMICKEIVLPYDRIKVSKTLDLKIENILLRSQEFYNEHNIQLKLGLPAESLNVQKQFVKLCNQEEISYSHLFIATGSAPRKLDVPGNDLKHIFTIRNYTDAEEVQKLLTKEKRVVILGTGFIGMEVAAYCTGKCNSVTVIMQGCIPFQNVFGDEIGNRIKRDFSEKGVKFISKSGICEFLPNESNPQVVGQVKIADGSNIPADIVILGIGSTYNTEWLQNSGIKLMDDGTISVDKYLRTNVENIFAGGDIARAPVYCAGDIPAAIGHFGLAHYHGRIAALNICNKPTVLKSVPFFWTMLFGKGYRYAGFGKFDNVKICGSLEELKFFAYYFSNGVVVAMSSVGRDPIVSEFANFLYEGKKLNEKDINVDPIKWIQNKPKDLLSTQKS